MGFSSSNLHKYVGGAEFFALLWSNKQQAMNAKRLFSTLYILALIMLLLYATHDAVGIPPTPARFLYYAAMTIFGAGLIRIFYLILRNRK
jgi:hypothetical protein